MNDVGNCLVCNRKDLSSCFPEYRYCTNCFHIQKDNLSKGYKYYKYNSNKDAYAQFVLKKIEEMDWKNRSHVNVLVVDDTSTKLLDDITDVLLKSVGKYRLTTVSLSNLYNGSFFSRHKHNKLSLSDYTSDMLKAEYCHFDLIVLNDTLTYTDDPNGVLNSCKKLCKDTTVIMSINFYSSLLCSMNLLLLDNSVNNIFNTNSLKTLCNRSKLQLLRVVNHKELIISIIIGCEEKKIDEVILDKLYDEITCNLYDKQIYSVLNNYWCRYIDNIRYVLQRYKDVGYKIVQISDLSFGENYFTIEYDNTIHTNDLENIDKINKNDSDDKNVVVVLDYNGTSVVRNTIKTFSKRSWLYFDLYHLIAYHI